MFVCPATYRANGECAHACASELLASLAQERSGNNHSQARIAIQTFICLQARETYTYRTLQLRRQNNDMPVMPQ
eukprot:5759335-Alexandrium_andersonii.AAC.1